ncbi:MAG: hypothetical protein IKJ89_07815 [Kiritimatiellae bacterium]|nr:hypothetical protein [Kiritimatiellia bacterium]
MKKLIAVAAIAAFVLPLCAATAASEMVTAEDVADELTVEEDNGLDVKVDAPRKNVALWPAFIAIWDFPETPDLVGFRITVPCSTKQENVTGLDVGFWGRSEYFEGIQLNVLRNDVRDSCAGIQVGCYNSVARGDLFGIQVGLWNESMSHRGIQFGAINVSGDSQGLQIGLINRSETMYGFQFGLINIIRDAEFQFMPILNVGF